MTEREAYIALNMMGKVGPVTVRALVAALGSARGIWEAGRSDLMTAKGVGRELADHLLARRAEVDPGAEIERAERGGGRILAQIDEEYPEPLRQIHDPPLALYVRGALQSRDRHAVAVVGTRRPTRYGRETAGRFAGELAQAGFTVVSGLAEGIDTHAHRAAIEAGGRTVAVLGSPLDRVYPRANAGLAEDASRHGAVLSELPFGRAPDRTTFPMRNRIVSGMSMGILVVEAGARSGALITAREAVEQGRAVFAVPGRIDSEASSGCHALIRQGAALVTRTDELVGEFEFLIPPAARRPRNGAGRCPALSAEETRVVAALAEGEMDVDALIRCSGLSPAAMGSVLLTLEMKKVIRMLPGRTVERVR